MTIAVDIRPVMSLPRTGVGVFTMEVVRELIQNTDHHWILFYSGVAQMDCPFVEADNVEIVHLPYPNKILNVALQWLKLPKIDTLLEKRTGKKIEAIFLPNLGFWSVTDECKTILTVHDLSFTLFPEFFSWKQRLWHRYIAPKKQIEQAQTIIVPSMHTKRDVMRLYQKAAKDVVVAHLGLSSLMAEASTQYQQQSKQWHREIARVKNTYNLPKKYLLFLGAIEPRKNVPLLLSAFRTWKQKYPRFTTGYSLVVAGPKGWSSRYEHTKMQQAHDIMYLGHVPEKDKPYIYSLADTFVFPSIYEGFGLPILEAMSVGVPVITSHRASLAEVAHDAAYFINPYDEHELVQALYHVLGNKKIKQRYKERGLKRVRDFHFSQTAQKIVQALEQ